jgi:Acyl-coenzyme A:6-aminopenicillanic acid acyl-transferase
MPAALTEQRLGDLRWLVLSGPAEEAFTSLGAYTRAEIGDVLENCPQVAQLRRHVASPPGSQLLAAVRHTSAARFPQAWAELAAMAGGAGVDVDDLALLNFRGDLGTVGPATAEDGGACSDLAWRRGRSFIAHNEDQPQFFDGRCVLLTLALEGQQPVWTFWIPGFVPGNTFTATGSGLVWSIDHLPVGSPGPGAGRHLVARGLQRAAGSVDQAIKYLRSRPSAGGFAYTIGNRAGRVVSVEAAAGQHAWREAGTDGALMWHTNHGRYVAGADPGPLGTSVPRGQVLAGLEEPAGEPDASWFVSVLAGATLPLGVRAEPSAASSAVTVCTFVASLTDGEVTVLSRGSAAVTVPLTDLVYSGANRAG